MSVHWAALNGKKEIRRCQKSLTLRGPDLEYITVNFYQASKLMGLRVTRF